MDDLVQPISVDASETSESAAGRRPGTKGKVGSGEGPSRCVILVEDDDSVRESLGTVLRLYGFSVSEFASAEAFLEHAKITSGTVLVFDIDLPGISGLQALARLRDAGNSVPAIAVSGRATDEMRREAKRLDAIAFLDKPIDLDRLIACLASSS